MRKSPAVIALTVCAMLTGCGLADKTADPNISNTTGAGATGTAKAKAKTSKYYVIRYEVAGSSGYGDVSYTTPSGMSQNSNTRTPWHKTFKVRKTEFQMLDVSAMNRGSGSITCTIYVDGKKVKAGRSTGQYSNVGCTHNIGGL